MGLFLCLWAVFLLGWQSFASCGLFSKDGFWSWLVFARVGLFLAHGPLFGLSLFFHMGCFLTGSYGFVGCCLGGFPFWAFSGSWACLHVYVVSASCPWFCLGCFVAFCLLSRFGLAFLWADSVAFPLDGKFLAGCFFGFFCAFRGPFA